MSHGHDHTHAHVEIPQGARYQKQFAIGVALNVGFATIELILGLLVGSLALVADAGHNLSDVLGLLLAWGASRLTLRKPTLRRTYGFRRATILASLLNAVILLVAMGAVAWEAIRRFGHPVEVPGGTIMLVAGIGVIINTATALMFVSGRHRDLNIKGAYLHMAADAAVSLGVVLAGLLVTLTGWSWLDPAISLAIVVIVVVGTWGLLRDSVDLLIDSVPRNVDPVAVSRFLKSLPGVEDVHDLHIWAMSTTEVALTAHLIKSDDGGDHFLNEVADELRHRFGIQHTTLQVERGEPDEECPRAKGQCA